MPTPFGNLPDGRAVQRHVIGSVQLELHVLDLGATAHQLHVAGHGNVLLGHGDAASQLETRAYLGSTVGRYANRIAKGQFTLDGHLYQLGTNEGPHTLHGGPDGFHRRLWRVVDVSASSITLALDSPDGDQGFPGNLSCTATYTVDGDTVTIAYRAHTDKPTPVNLTNHAYFNLDGEAGDSIDRHQIVVHASRYTPIAEDLIPLGRLAEVAASPLDLRVATPIGPVIRHPDQQLLWARGLDHNFAIDGLGMRPAASLYSAASGLGLTVSTDQPGLQVYTANHLDGAIAGPSGRVYRQGAGIALETQLFPDSPNQESFPTSILEPDHTYHSITTWQFSRDPEARA
ncbi:aldose epimerase family protein [Rhizocola hellebori]|nr:aldose epimerase family protein [Rhizocola hellebori]